MASPQILICHSPEAAKAGKTLTGLQTWIYTTFNWDGCRGQRLVIWAPNTGDGLRVAEANVMRGLEAGADVKLIEPGADDPHAWDAAAAIDAGWDRDKAMAWIKERVQVMSLPDDADVPQEGDYGVPAPEPSPQPEPHLESAMFALPPLAGSDIDWRSQVHEPKWDFLGLIVVKGSPVCNVDTVLRILGKHPQLGDVLWYDEFLQRIMRKDQKTKQPREWADADEVDLLALLQRDIGLNRLKLTDVRSAVISVAFRNRKNCATDWLNSLKWDGKPRLDEFFQDTFGCDSTVYSRAVSKNFWISMVARVMDPGCKVDNMVILEGSQGAGKSSSMELLGGDWFAVQHEQVTGKGFYEILEGKMLIEISEMEAFNKSEVTKVKGVITTRQDRYRDAYGRYARDHKRTSIFVGTTNKDDWNRDETGARRFWPIRCRQSADMALLKANREQLFAEAVARWRKGESWWEMPLLETTAEQDERREDDTWLDPVEEWLDDPYKTRVTVGEVLWGAIKMPLADQHNQHLKRMGAVLQRLKWTKKHTAKGNAWFRPEK